MTNVPLNDEEIEVLRDLIEEKLNSLEEDELEAASYGDPEQYKKALTKLASKLEPTN